MTEAAARSGTAASVLSAACGGLAVAATAALLAVHTSPYLIAVPIVAGLVALVAGMWALAGNGRAGGGRWALAVAGVAAGGTTVTGWAGFGLFLAIMVPLLSRISFTF